MQFFVSFAFVVGTALAGPLRDPKQWATEIFDAEAAHQPKLPSARDLSPSEFIQVSAQAHAKARAHAQWRFGSNYVPQHYGNWQFDEKGGGWNFGNDKRIECEACGYVMYMLIDRLGDEFNKHTIVDEMNALCPRVQWVFQSGCTHIFSKDADKIIDQVMRLTEPEDICKGLNYCAPDFYDSQMSGGTPGAAMPGAAAAMGSGMPWHGYGAGLGFSGNSGAVSLGTPGIGYATGQGASMYPSPGSKPMSPHSPYSPYSYGGYDPFGYPLPHPGVPSSTPPPPASSEGAAPAGR